jgi:hypothetical protein
MRIRLAIGVVLFFCLVSTPSFAQPSKKVLPAAGRVEAVAQNSITILVGADEITLVVDAPQR